MPAGPYDTLAGVYDWLVPDALVEPEGAAAPFADLLAPGARVLDCAAGSGTVAVGLALRGFEVVATDASAGMVERTRALAERQGVALEARTCAWAQLGAQGWHGRFDAVLCVGNSLTHAPGPAARRTALGAMAGVVRAGGLLAVTSRNWELVRASPPGLQVAETLTRRHGRDGLVISAWTIADDWDHEHHLDVAVALLGERVETRAERLSFWPFEHTTLLDELEAAGFAVASTTYAPDAERYLVTGTRR